MSARRFLGSACVLIMAAATAAAAQDTANAQPGTQGPMVVERVHDGWAIAPDVRTTKIDGAWTTLAGVYGGWVIDHTLLLGAGGYWQTNRSAPKLDYGGFVAQWRMWENRTIGVGARGLIGFGSATLSDTVTTVSFQLPHGFDPRIPNDPRMMPITQTVNVRVHRDVFVAEPQADLLLNLSRRFRIDVSGGYRLTSDDRGFERTVGNRLHGPSASLSLQIGS